MTTLDPESLEQLRTRVHERAKLLGITACLDEAKRTKAKSCRVRTTPPLLLELVDALDRSQTLDPANIPSAIIQTLAELHREAVDNSVDEIRATIPFGVYMRIAGAALRVDLSRELLTMFGRSLAKLAEGLDGEAPNVAEVLSLIGTDILEAIG